MMFPRNMDVKKWSSPFMAETYNAFEEKNIKDGRLLYYNEWKWCAITVWSSDDDETNNNINDERDFSSYALMSYS